MADLRKEARDIVEHVEKIEDMLSDGFQIIREGPRVVAEVIAALRETADFMIKFVEQVDEEYKRT